MNKQLKLIADSGSTKTDWLLQDKTECITVRTQGINPFMLGSNEISDIIKGELLPQLPLKCPKQVHFYGAGCRGEQTATLKEILHNVFPESTVEVESDMVGAARALCGKSEGVACILGTGENSCLFDGTRIIENIPPLGFILGDEGSGAALGKRLVGDILKKQLSEKIRRQFFTEYHMDVDEIIRRVYKSPLPNRFLASFTYFLHKNRKEKEIQSLIVEEFNIFFRRNVAAYKRPDLPVHFVGSIAVCFSEELRTAAGNNGFQVGHLLKSPLEKSVFL